MQLLAHSPRGRIPAQEYATHIKNVQGDAAANARRAAEYYAGEREAFVKMVAAAGLYHDLGKVDEANQAVLRRESFDPLPVKHEDAGVAELLRLRRVEPAVLVAAHHAGLFSQFEEMEKPRGQVFRNVAVAAHVNARLMQYVAAHAAAGCPTLDADEKHPLDKCGFVRRLALSCLVDADHGDTARNYGNEVGISSPPTRWDARLAVLDRFIGDLPEGDTERERARNSLRRRVYDTCQAAAVEPAIRACDAPVGSGKTTAVMAHLLRVAEAKRLRHIFVVLPYTNIIKQSVDVYRRALVLPGEQKDDIVAEHHHQADFSHWTVRQLATLWRAPIIVTTAVQFFETLASHHPAHLRKFHELPGSAVFVDETHAAIPSHLWPQVWRWLETWTQDWGGHLVLASGSLPRFWELRDFVDPPKAADAVPDLVPKSLREELVAAERQRVLPRTRLEALDCSGLVRLVTGAPGPRLLILNTVQSAAVVADRMCKSGQDALHLSTALAPAHRARIVEEIKARLKSKRQEWTLVATSCVEAGMDFSFRSGFRESCSVASLIQISGRVSRGGEYADASVWDFRVLDPLLTPHPGFTVPRRVLAKLFDDGQFDTRSPSDLAKEAMRLEVTAADDKRQEEILKAENGMEYPEVARLCRVIDADTRVVVIDANLVKRLRNGERCSPREVQQFSVQLWATKVADLALQPIFSQTTTKQDGTDLYAWSLPYDPDFLGYMAGVLPLLDGKQAGGFFI